MHGENKFKFVFIFLDSKRTGSHISDELQWRCALLSFHFRTPVSVVSMSYLSLNVKESISQHPKERQNRLGRRRRPVVKAHGSEDTAATKEKGMLRHELEALLLAIELQARHAAKE